MKKQSNNSTRNSRPSAKGKKQIIPNAYLTQNTTDSMSMKFINTKNGTRIAHRELVTIVSQTTSDTAASWTINPGDTAGPFAWLPYVARSFAKYRVNRLVFDYVPTCATTTSGSFNMCWVPDPMDQAPNTVNDLLVNQYKISVAVYQQGSINIPTDVVRVGQDMYVRTSTSDTSDLRLTDMGRLSYRVPQGSGTTNVGQIYVSYDISFYHPTIENSGDYSGLFIKQPDGSWKHDHTTYGTPNNIEVINTSADQVNIKPKTPGTYSVDTMLSSGLRNFGGLSALASGVGTFNNLYNLYQDFTTYARGSSNGTYTKPNSSGTLGFWRNDNSAFQTGDQLYLNLQRLYDSFAS